MTIHLSTPSRQSGFEVTSLIVAGLAVLLVGFAGYKVWQSSHSGPVAATVASGSLANVPLPKSVQNKTDLTQLSHALDASATQINTSLSGSSLNAALNSML